MHFEKCNFKTDSKIEPDTFFLSHESTVKFLKPWGLPLRIQRHRFWCVSLKTERKYREFSLKIAFKNGILKTQYGSEDAKIKFYAFQKTHVRNLSSVKSQRHKQRLWHCRSSCVSLKSPQKLYFQKLWLSQVTTKSRHYVS